MKLEFALNGHNSGQFFVGYAPVKCSVKNLDIMEDGAPIEVTLKNHDLSARGQVVFYITPDAAESDEINIPVPNSGEEAVFYIGGKYERVSEEYGDTAIDFLVGSKIALHTKLMVRVRKNANKLSPLERDTFIEAFADFVASGDYARFLSMHGEVADSEIHGRSSFLPWHRIFLLDLERNLQVKYPTVTIPYWDFQSKAENVFTADFMGVPDIQNAGILKYTSGHKFEKMNISGSKLVRIPRFKTEKEKALVEDYNITTGRGPGFFQFVTMEGNPHGYAHTSFRRDLSPIGSPETATQDPLFYMLHANIDRLWAEWQALGKDNVRFDGFNIDSYSPESDGSPARIGDFPNNTMWPWNGIRGTGNITDENPRPDMTVPSGPLIPSPYTEHPGGEPTVLDTIDYQGRLTGKSLNFDYDTIPYLNAADLHAETSSSAWTKVNSIKKLQKISLHSELKKVADLEAFKAVPVEAESTIPAASSLSKLPMLDEQESIDKALNILTDKSIDAGLRTLALSRLTRVIGNDEKLIEYVIALAADQSEAEDLRKQAFRTLEILEFSSVKVKAMKPVIRDALRGMISDPNLEIRHIAIGSLAQMKDEFIQRVLKEGIEEPSKALVSENLAVHLLGLDRKAAIFPLLRKVVLHSSNNDSRANALAILGNDPDSDSKQLLIDVFNNKKERFEVRMNSLLSLNRQLDKQEFDRLALKTIEDIGEDEDLRVISVGALKSATLPESTVNTLRQIQENNVSKNLSNSIKSFLKDK